LFILNLLVSLCSIIIHLKRTVMKRPIEKKLVFIIIWATYVGVFLVFLDLVNFSSWEFWGTVLALNVLGFYIYYKVTGESSFLN